MYFSKIYIVELLNVDTDRRYLVNVIFTPVIMSKHLSSSSLPDPKHSLKSGGNSCALITTLSLKLLKNNLRKWINTQFWT